MLKSALNRRNFVKMGLGSAAGVFAMKASISNAVAEVCRATAPQTSGPFYPGESKFTPDTDLTRVEGRIFF